MNEKKHKLFVDVLTKPYDQQAYVRFLQELFNKMQLVAPGKFNKVYGSAAKVVEVKDAGLRKEKRADRVAKPAEGKSSGASASRWKEKGSKAA